MSRRGAADEIVVSGNDGAGGGRFMRYTREGFHRGINSGAHRDYSWIVKGVGTLTGGVAGWYISKKALRTTLRQYSALRTYAQVPVVIFGTVTSAALGKELAIPAATVGIKTGKTLRWSLEGLQYDVLGLGSGVRPSWEKQESRLKKLIGSAINQGAEASGIRLGPAIESGSKSLDEMDQLLQQVEEKIRVSQAQGTGPKAFSARIKWDGEEGKGGDGGYRVEFIEHDRPPSQQSDRRQEEAGKTTDSKLDLVVPGLGKLRVKGATNNGMDLTWEDDSEDRQEGRRGGK